jgi:hypothetical protein
VPELSLSAGVTVASQLGAVVPLSPATLPDVPPIEEHALAAATRTAASAAASILIFIVPLISSKHLSMPLAA